MLLDDVKNYIIKILFCNIMPRPATAPATTPATTPVKPQQGFTVPGSQVPGSQVPLSQQTANLDFTKKKPKKSKLDFPVLTILAIAAFIIAALIVLGFVIDNDNDNAGNNVVNNNGNNDDVGNCTTDGNCSSGKVCINNVCTPSPPSTGNNEDDGGNCTTNGDCSSGKVCINNVCTPSPPSTEPESAPVCSPSCAAPTQTCINSTCYDKCNSAKCSDDEICVIPSQGSLDEYTIASPSIGPSNISGYVCIASPSDDDLDGTTEGYINYSNKRWIEGRPDMNENDKNVLLPGDNSLFK